MKDRTDFLLEIGCEEIPASMIARAAGELKGILEKYFSAYCLLDGTGLDAFGAPRRLVAMSRAVRLRQPDVTKESVGPPKSVAYDNVGRPTKATESFAAKLKIPVAKLYTVSTPRGEYVAAKQVIAGRPAMDILAEVLPRAILEITFPRTMYWRGKNDPRFIRPIRWLVALLGGRRIGVCVAGVNSGRDSSGHRFLGKVRVAVRGAGDYLAKLRRNFVLADPNERRRRIDREIHRVAAAKGVRVRPDAALLEQVVYLDEYPSAVLGDFDPGYLDLPEEILVTVMRDHQKYFALERRGGGLAPHFIAIINLDRDRAGLIRAGHERVLRARFADARFFWDTDQKCRLPDYLPKLAHVTYESRLGSYGDKVERCRWLARWLAEQWFNAGIHQADVPAADRAAELSKADLVTEMVREFPELQGIVGGLYAKEQGEPDEVAWAVYDQYRPVGLDDPIPRNLTGCALAIADKLDSLVGCFAIGLIPSGSSDPFGLRRAALGIVKILLERNLPLSLSASVSAAARALGEYLPKLKLAAAVEKQALEFIVDRARYIFRERMAYAYDEVNAALAAGADDLVDAEKRMAAVKAIRATKNFEPLAVAFKRIRKILERAGPANGWKQGSVRPDLFSEEAEKQLHAASVRVAAEARELKRSAKYREALQAIAGLRPAIDRFFDDVLVMAEEEATRKNRLTLLAELLREFSTIADFSEIAAGEAR